jgi:glycosyltransferase involved in cell wall biosynthesis
MEFKLRNLSVIYLGRRGGGATFLAGFANFVSQNNLSHKVDFYISDSNESHDFPDNSNLDITRIRIPHSAKEIFSKPFITLKSLLYSVIRIKKRSLKILFLMPSPFDWFFDRCISGSEIEKYFIIHDAKPHLGEKWPSEKSLRWRFRTGRMLITLSKHVQNEILLAEPNSRIITLFHPIFLLSDPPRTSGSNLKLNFKYSLFIGRIREYKGVDLLLDAIQSIPSEEFVIAGEGEITSELPSNCYKINRWLEEGEMKELIQNAQLIIFPYLEASQSGLLPIALDFNKTVVISNVSGLMEQASNYAKAFTFEAGNVESLIGAISSAKLVISKNPMEMNNDGNRSKNNSQQEFWEKLLSSIDFYASKGSIDQ